MVDPRPTNLTRRALLGSGLAIAAAMGVGRWAGSAVAPARAAAPAETGPVAIERFSAAGVSGGVETVARSVHSESEWRRQLPPESFEVLRREGTERAYSGALWDQHADGLYRCLGCDTALFDSHTKFESGTGWPSFTQAISDRNVARITDRSFGMARTAVSCQRCAGHLGHVFDDGPAPTGLRFCMNSAALRFVARA